MECSPCSRPAMPGLAWPSPLSCGELAPPVWQGAFPLLWGRQPGSRREEEKPRFLRGESRALRPVGKWVHGLYWQPWLGQPGSHRGCECWTVGDVLHQDPQASCCSYPASSTHLLPQFTLGVLCPSSAALPGQARAGCRVQ